ncbi:hypothetical protein EUX98_g2555 [Antrodiella citrinella]|uniref:Methyltransferase domain-containing protein n=1 Tax=Antrodiella citrinella TaxID=2447956 RepID=A0A4S4N0W4_9APHY|nr:hypothetical protein EUX98_g2555 [Antrodiella citrinella]
MPQEHTPDASLIPSLDPSILTLDDSERAFLHASISNDEAEVRKRVSDVQERAYAKYPYPCIRAFHHVNLMMSKNAIYGEVLEAGQSGDTIFLDLGCCMGTDVRKLVFDGYPASNVVGCDLRQEFIDLGYELYKDRSSCAIRFIVDDIFDADAPTDHAASDLAQVTRLCQLKDRVSHFYLGALFHLYDEQTQFAIALAVGKLLHKEKGGIAFGRHHGVTKEGVADDHLGRNRYAHSPTSWTTMWRQVFTQLVSAEFANSRIVVDAVLNAGFAKEILGAPSQTGMMYWSVKIV